MIYYESITVRVVCNNGSEKHGANASTVISTDKEGKTKMTVTKFGRTRAMAKYLLEKLLTEDSECIGSFNKKKDV